MQPTAGERPEEAMPRLGICTGTHAGDGELQRQCVARIGVRWGTETEHTGDGDEELRRQCVVRIGVRWGPETERAGDDELRRKCVARLGVCWSRAPSPPAQDPDTRTGDGAELTLVEGEEGGWMSGADTSTVASPVSGDSGGDSAQYRAVASGLAGVGTWFDDVRRMAHEAEDAERRQRDMADENRRIRDQLDAAQKEASGWRRAAEDLSSRNETLRAQAEEAGESAQRCSDLLRQAAEAQQLREEELGRARRSEQGALERAAEAEDKSKLLQAKVQALTSRAVNAEAVSTALREELLGTRAGYEEKLAQANRDIDMRTEELNSMQDRLEEVVGEKGRKERRAKG